MSKFPNLLLLLLLLWLLLLLSLLSLLLFIIYTCQTLSSYAPWLHSFFANGFCDLIWRCIYLGSIVAITISSTFHGCSFFSCYLHVRGGIAVAVVGKCPSGFGTRLAWLLGFSFSTSNARRPWLDLSSSSSSSSFHPPHPPPLLLLYLLPGLVVDVDGLLMNLALP